MTSIAQWPTDPSGPVAASIRSRSTAPPSAWDGWGKPYVRLFWLACFFPYPALSVGGKNGLQLSQAMALVGVLALAARPPGRPFAALLAMIGPLFISSFFNTLRPGTPEAVAMIKESVALTVALSVIWPAAWLADPGRFRDLLKAAAAATVAHALLGLYQAYSFTRDEFPLVWLYVNPSFKDMGAWAESYARYMKRPCGLFPEPSAMASSLGPWLVVMAGQLIDPTPGIDLGRRGRFLSAVAVAGGFLLLAMSRSGSTLAIAAGVGVVGAVKAPGWVRSMGVGKALVGAALAAGAVGMAYSVVAQIGSGFDDRIESSWGLRGQSIATGLTANTEPLSLCFGVGPAQSTPIVRALMAGVSLPVGQDDFAVWSLAVCYYMETGLVGGLALAAVMAMAARSILRSSAVALGLGSLGAWVVGVTVTTSYMALSPVWLFLGAVLEWDRIFPRRPRAEGVTR